MLAEAIWADDTDCDNWVSMFIPPGKEIIGFHGSKDGTGIKSLGMIIWKPDPFAEVVLDNDY